MVKELNTSQWPRTKLQWTTRVVSPTVTAMKGRPPPPSFSSVAMTKTFQHLKQWQPTRIVAALSLESVRIVSRYKVHKRLKTAVALNLVLLAKPNGYPTFYRRRFSREHPWGSQLLWPTYPGISWEGTETSVWCLWLLVLLWVCQVQGSNSLAST